MWRPIPSTIERTLLHVVLVVLMNAAWSAVAAAAEPPAAAATPAVATILDAGAPAGAPRKAVAAADPAIARMQAEIEANLARERQTVEELQARFARTTDPQAALALQHEVEQVKKDAQLEVLRIQLRHAQESGATQAARELQTAVDQFAVPPAPSGARAMRDLPPAKTQVLPGAAPARP